MNTQKPRLPLESLIKSSIPSYHHDSLFRVIVFELWGEAEGGWSVNNVWPASECASLAHALEIARYRWEVYKDSYGIRALVSDLDDTSFEKSRYEFEIGGIPLVTLEVL